MVASGLQVRLRLDYPSFLKHIICLLVIKCNFVVFGALYVLGFERSVQLE